MGKKIEKMKQMSTFIVGLQSENEHLRKELSQMKIEIGSWQSTHSQIYDSLHSSTKLAAFYKAKCDDLQSQTDSNARKSEENLNAIAIDNFDVEAELEFNSDFTSSDEDSSCDSIGGGHARHGSKPWMQIKRRMDKKKK